MHIALKVGTMHPRTTTTSSTDKSESIAKTRESRVLEANVYKTSENETECCKPLVPFNAKNTLLKEITVKRLYKEVIHVGMDVVRVSKHTIKKYYSVMY
jgi:hypothetical protein